MGSTSSPLVLVLLLLTAAASAYLLRRYYVVRKNHTGFAAADFWGGDASWWQLLYAVLTESKGAKLSSLYLGRRLDWGVRVLACLCSMLGLALYAAQQVPASAAALSLAMVALVLHQGTAIAYEQSKRKEYDEKIRVQHSDTSYNLLHNE